MHLLQALRHEADGNAYQSSETTLYLSRVPLSSSLRLAYRSALARQHQVQLPGFVVGWSRSRASQPFSYIVGSRSAQGSQWVHRSITSYMFQKRLFATGSVELAGCWNISLAR